MFIDKKEKFYFYKYSTLSTFEKTCYQKLIYKFVNRLVWEYPNFKQWFEGLFAESQELKQEREIIFCEQDFQIIGVAILKSNQDEKKICTLRVAKEFQHQGVGRKLMELSFEWLQSDRPIITMHKNKQKEFSALLDYFGFELEQQQRNYYYFFSTECVYNGVLPTKDLTFNKIEIINIHKLYKKFIETGTYDFNEFLNACYEMLYKQESYRRMQMLNY